MAEDQIIEVSRGAIINLRNVLIMAKEDLQDLHNEAFKHTTSYGETVYDPCGGCHTCQETLPAIESILKVFELPE